MVECELPKLEVRVRFPSPAPKPLFFRSFTAGCPHPRGLLNGPPVGPRITSPGPHPTTTRCPRRLLVNFYVKSVLPRCFPRRFRAPSVKLMMIRATPGERSGPPPPESPAKSTILPRDRAPLGHQMGKGHQERRPSPTAPPPHKPVGCATKHQGSPNFCSNNSPRARTPKVSVA